MNESFASHLATYLGAPTGCWPVDPAGRRMPFQIRAYSGMYASGADRRVLSYCTVGLWKKSLSGKEAGVRVREELILMVRDTPDADLLPGVLLQVVAEALASRRAWLPGDVVGPRGPIVPDAETQAFYVTAPSYLPDPFHVWRAPNTDKVGVLWLVPITRTEAEFVREHGAAAFEEVLVAEQPDLLNVMRTAVPLPSRIVLHSHAPVEESGEMPAVLPARLPTTPAPAPPDEHAADFSGSIDEFTAESTFDGGVLQALARMAGRDADPSGELGRRPPALAPVAPTPQPVVRPEPEEAHASGEPPTKVGPISLPMVLDEGWDADGLGALADADRAAGEDPPSEDPAGARPRRESGRRAGRVGRA